MKILVTGAAGFIGSYVSRALIRRGDDVVGIDNFNDYYPRNCKEFNVDLINLSAKNSISYTNGASLAKVHEKLESYYPQNSQQLGTFKFIEGDIVNYEFIKDLFEKEKFDGVIHLAAMAGVPLSLKKPRTYVEVNVDGTMNLLEAAKETNTKKLVFASSSSVYGNRDDKKVEETDNVMSAVSPYGASKVAGEVLCHSCAKVFGINVTVNRIFGPIYGPIQRPYGMFMQRAINFAYNGKTVQIYGRKGLDSAKDSTYIDDQVNGMLLCLDYNKTDFEVFNIGTSSPQSIRVWLDEIKKHLGDKVKYEVIESDKGDVASSANIEKAISVLGYKPQIQLEEGVKRQIEIFELMPEWYKTQQNV
jgi:UDP-glucuronate 4-epimerase